MSCFSSVQHYVCNVRMKPFSNHGKWEQCRAWETWRKVRLSNSYSLALQTLEQKRFPQQKARHQKTMCPLLKFVLNMHFSPSTSQDSLLSNFIIIATTYSRLLSALAVPWRTCQDSVKEVAEMLPFYSQGALLSLACCLLARVFQDGSIAMISFRHMLLIKQCLRCKVTKNNVIHMKIFQIGINDSNY